MFSGANDRPIINNLNTDLYVREDEAVGTTVLPLAAYDAKNDNPTLTYTLSTVPSTASELFQIIGQYVVQSLCVVKIRIAVFVVTGQNVVQSLCIVKIRIAVLLVRTSCNHCVSSK